MIDLPAIRARLEKAKLLCWSDRMDEYTRVVGKDIPALLDEIGRWEQNDLDRQEQIRRLDKERLGYKIECERLTRRVEKLEISKYGHVLTWDERHDPE